MAFELPKTVEGNCKLVKVRLGYPNLFKARENMQGDLQYDCALYVLADDAQKAAIDAEVLRVAQEKWKEKAQSVLDTIEGNTNKMCWVDGKRKSMPGYWVLSTKRKISEGAPTVVDSDHNPKAGKPHVLTERDTRPYAGCHVNATLKIWAWDNGNGKGISCTLVGIQFHSDGDAFSSAPVASDEGFDDLSQGADAGGLV